MIGQAALALARQYLGVRERRTNIVPFAPRTVRGGQWIYVQGGAWCARFVSEMVWKAWAAETSRDAYFASALAWTADTGDLPIGYRAAVSELCDDARATGRLHVTRAGVASGAKAAGDPNYAPSEGDLAVFGRAGGNPLLGGTGHIAFFVTGTAGGAVEVLGGNQGDAVTEEPRALREVLAWIEMS